MLILWKIIQVVLAQKKKHQQ